MPRVQTLCPLEWWYPLFIVTTRNSVSWEYFILYLYFIRLFAVCQTGQASLILKGPIIQQLHTWGCKVHVIARGMLVHHAALACCEHPYMKCPKCGRTIFCSKTSFVAAWSLQYSNETKTCDKRNTHIVPYARRQWSFYKARGTNLGLPIFIVFNLGRASPPGRKIHLPIADKGSDCVPFKSRMQKPSCYPIHTPRPARQAPDYNLPVYITKYPMTVCLLRNTALFMCASRIRLSFIYDPILTMDFKTPWHSRTVVPLPCCKFLTHRFTVQPGSEGALLDSLNASTCYQGWKREWSRRKTKKRWNKYHVCNFWPSRRPSHSNLSQWQWTLPVTKPPHSSIRAHQGVEVFPVTSRTRPYTRETWHTCSWKRGLLNVSPVWKMNTNKTWPTHLCSLWMCSECPPVAGSSSAIQN